MKNLEHVYIIKNTDINELRSLKSFPMNNSVLKTILSFIGLVLLQVWFCSNINFLGDLNPLCVCHFYIVIPLSQQSIVVYFSSFLLGLSIDIFLDSGGMHAAASVAIAYIRPLF